MIYLKKVFSSILIISLMITSLLTSITAFSEVISKSSSTFSDVICKFSFELTATFSPSEVIVLI